jgi:hypothetical protein
MEHDKTQSAKNTKGCLLQHLIAKYLPSENSTLANLLRQLMIVWKGVKVLCVLCGIVVICKAVLMVGTAYRLIPAWVVTGISKVTVFFIPLFLQLLKTSLLYLWQPILLYVLMACLTKSEFWRKFWCLVGVSGFLIIFVSKIEEFSWKEYQVLPLLLIQGYLFMLWLLPPEFWNIIGLGISTMLGLIILLLPDLPGAFDDFGMFGAILAFFLGYLNALASLVQRVVRRL